MDDITTFDHELKSLDVKNSSGLWMICAILGRELKDPDIISNSWLWMI